MPYDIKYLQDGLRREMQSHGTGTGTLYVRGEYSDDGVVDLIRVVAKAAPSTFDTFNEGSTWVDITPGSVKEYIKTASGTWVVKGDQTA